MHQNHQTLGTKSIWRPLALLVIGFLVGCFGPEDPGEEGEYDGELRSLTVPEVRPPGPNGLSFNRSLLERNVAILDGVKIRDQMHRKGRVIYSVKLRDLSSDERLLLRGEVTLSRCNYKDIWGLSGDADTTPCKCPELQQSPYGYTPRFSAAFFLKHAVTEPD